MNDAASNLTKRLDLCVISSFSLESVDFVDVLSFDGRSNLIEERPEQPGGMGAYATTGVRMFDADAVVAPGGLIGADDADRVCQLTRRIGAEPRYLVAVPGKRTNRSSVILGVGDQKLIIRRTQPISFDHDLTGERRRLLLGLVAQSRACLVGNLPVEFTEQLIEFGRKVGTYVALGAGKKQLSWLSKMRPHALFLNLDEARRATGLRSDDPEQVFEGLLNVAGTEHMVVMTGGGSRPIRVADRRTGVRWTIDPVEMRRVPETNGHLYTLGAGDVLAGVVTMLLGARRSLITGEVVREIVRFGQDVAAAHVSQSAWAAKQVRARYAEMRALIESQSETKASDVAA